MLGTWWRVSAGNTKPQTWTRVVAGLLLFLLSTPTALAESGGQGRRDQRQSPMMATVLVPDGGGGFRMIRQATQLATAIATPPGRSVRRHLGRQWVYSVPVPRSPGQLVLSPDGGTAYALCRGHGVIAQIDLKSKRLLKTLDMGTFPSVMLPTQDGRLLFVVNASSQALEPFPEVENRLLSVPGANGNVVLVDTSTLTATAEVKLASQPLSAVLTLDGARLFVVSRDVTEVVDTESAQVIGTIPTGGNYVVLADRGRKLVVARVGATALSIVDVASWSTVSLPLPYPVGVPFMVTNDEGRIVAGPDGCVVDANRNTVLSSTASLSWGALFHPDGLSIIYSHAPGILELPTLSFVSGITSVQPSHAEFGRCSSSLVTTLYGAPEGALTLYETPVAYDVTLVDLGTGQARILPVTDKRVSASYSRDLKVTRSGSLAVTSNSAINEVSVLDLDVPLPPPAATLDLQPLSQSIELGDVARIRLSISEAQRDPVVVGLDAVGPPTLSVPNQVTLPAGSLDIEIAGTSEVEQGTAYPVKATLPASLGASSARAWVRTVAPSLSRYIVPTARLGGLGTGDPRCHTDVEILNYTYDNQNANITFRADTPHGVLERQVVLAPLHMGEWQDLVSTLFGLPDDYRFDGPIVITSTAPLAVSSLTYSEGARGPCRDFLPGVSTRSSSASESRPGFLPDLGSRSRERTDLLLVNAREHPCAVAVELVGSSGVSVAQQTLEVAGLATVEIADLLGTFGATDASPSYAVVRPLCADAAVSAFARVVDSTTGDETTSPEVFTSDRSPILVPNVLRQAAGQGEGAVADLDLVNTGSQASTVLLHLRDALESTTREVVLRGRESKHWDDVVRTLFGWPEDRGFTGWIVIESSGSVVASGRARRACGNGFLGQSLPAISTADWTRNLGCLLLPIRQGGSFSSELVVANASDRTCKVDYGVLGPDGRRLGTTATVTLGAFTSVVVPDLATSVGVPGELALAAAYLESTDRCVVWGSATLIDRVSGDRTTLTPSRR